MNTEAPSTELRFFNRITRDITDGLIFINNDGTVQYVNPSAAELLADPSLKEGVKYAACMSSDERGINDDFHQYVLDSIYEKELCHTGAATYTRPDGSVRCFNMQTSYARSDDGMHKSGVILQFSDITELHKAKIKHDDSVKILAAMVAVTAIWNFIYAIWLQAGKPISQPGMSWIINGTA